MKAQRDPKTGKWFIQYRFTDWQGNRRKSTKRGFDTKREAEAWLAKFLQKSKADFDMPFEEFVKLYGGYGQQTTSYDSGQQAIYHR